MLTDLLAVEEAKDDEEKELESLDRQLSDIADALGGECDNSNAAPGNTLDVSRLQELVGAEHNVI